MKKTYTPTVAPARYHETLAEKSALWGDQYALTMSQALFAHDEHDINTTFQAYIRKTPFKGSYLLTAGQNIIFEWIKNNWRFDKIDIEVLREEQVYNPTTNTMKRLYNDDFLAMLKDSRCELTIDAMPEGEIAFPDEPIMRINGPIWQCLMVEGAILNAINSQSLFATLASRICYATDYETVLELGLRRAQTIGGLEPTRASYIGGITATSNTLAKKYYGIASSGTMAHALVMLYEDEITAFDKYAKAMPHNSVFLVDTYDTVQGVRNAIQACKDNNIAMKGIRLDSGDMADLSIQARAILDANGFTDAKIAASNDLDEQTITDLKARGARIDIWGVGTNLVTSAAQPALGAVYKLAAVYDDHKTLSQDDLDALKEQVRYGITDPSELKAVTRDVIKLSGDAVKVSIPGEVDVIRTLKKDATGQFKFNGDTIIQRNRVAPIQEDTLRQKLYGIVKNNPTEQVVYDEGTKAYRPIRPFFKNGELIGQIETVHDARDRAHFTLENLSDEHRHMTNPQSYSVTLEHDLYQTRQEKIRLHTVPAIA